MVLFKQAVGSRLNMTEAYRADIRSRRIDRSAGDGVNHAYRHTGDKAFFFPKSMGA